MEGIPTGVGAEGNWVRQYIMAPTTEFVGIRDLTFILFRFIFWFKVNYQDWLEIKAFLVGYFFWTALI